MRLFRVKRNVYIETIDFGEIDWVDGIFIKDELNDYIFFGNLRKLGVTSKKIIKANGIFFNGSETKNQIEKKRYEIESDSILLKNIEFYYSPKKHSVLFMNCSGEMTTYTFLNDDGVIDLKVSESRRNERKALISFRFDSYKFYKNDLKIKLKKPKSSKVKEKTEYRTYSEYLAEQVDRNIDYVNYLNDLI